MDTLGNDKCIKILEFDVRDQENVITAMKAALTLDFSFTITHDGEFGTIVVRIFAHVINE